MEPIPYLTYAGKIIGIDISYSAIEFSRKNFARPNLNYIVMDAMNMAFKNDLFDLICLFDVIEHLPSQENFLREVQRLLRKKGMFIISTPKKGKGISPYHIHEFTLQEFNDLLSQFYNVNRLLAQNRPKEIFAIERKLSKWRKWDIANLRNTLPPRWISKMAYWVTKLKSITPPQELSLEDFTFSEGFFEDTANFVGFCTKK